MPFVKLDCGILDSSLWSEAADTRVAFLTLLAMARPDGLVEATAPGIARRAQLPLEAVRRALRKLEAPDPDSRSTAAEGRRIQRVDGGFLLINYAKYRAKDHTAAARKQRERDRRRQGVTRDARDGECDTVTVTQAEAETDTETDTETHTHAHRAADAAQLRDGDGNGARKGQRNGNGQRQTTEPRIVTYFRDHAADLDLVRKRRGDWAVTCPACATGNSPVHLLVKDGKALLRAHCGCATEDVLDALGLTLRDLYPQQSEKPA